MITYRPLTSDDLPAFIAAFTKRRGVTDRELEEVQNMIEQYRKEHSHD